MFSEGECKACVTCKAGGNQGRNLTWLKAQIKQFVFWENQLFCCAWQVFVCLVSLLVRRCSPFWSSSNDPRENGEEQEDVIGKPQGFRCRCSTCNYFYIRKKKSYSQVISMSSNLGWPYTGIACCCLNFPLCLATWELKYSFCFFSLLSSFKAKQVDCWDVALVPVFPTGFILQCLQPWCHFHGNQSPPGLCVGMGVWCAQRPETAPFHPKLERREKNR